jgi:hypothetical protein
MSTSSENPNKYSVSIAPEVYERMYQHVFFLAKVSVEASEQLLTRLLEDIRSLALFPERHPFYDRPFVKPGLYRSMISGKKWRILYQVEGRMVYVDDIEDCRQDDGESLLA